MKLGAQFPTFWGTRADLQKGSRVSWACCRAKGKWHRPSALSLQSQLWPVHDTCRRMWGSRDASRPGSGAHKIARPSYCSQGEEALPLRGWGAAQPPVWPRVLCATRGEGPAFCFPVADAQPSVLTWLQCESHTPSVPSCFSLPVLEEPQVDRAGPF